MSITTRVDELLIQGLSVGAAISQAVTEDSHRVDYFDQQRKLHLGA